VIWDHALWTCDTHSVPLCHFLEAKRGYVFGMHCEPRAWVVHVALRALGFGLFLSDLSASRRPFHQ
jgi:hypothetical protein